MRQSSQNCCDKCVLIGFLWQVISRYKLEEGEFLGRFELFNPVFGNGSQRTVFKGQAADELFRRVRAGIPGTGALLMRQITLLQLVGDSGV